MATLYDRIKPIIYIGHLCGMGYFNYGRFWIINYLLILINLMEVTSVYISIYIHIITTSSMMYNLSTIMAVIRLHVRFLTPIFMIVFLNVNKTVILNYTKAFDRIFPSIQNISLTPFLINFVGWIVTTVMAEFLQIMMFHLRTKFAYYTTAIHVMRFVLSNIWIVTPVLQYTFIMSIIHHGIRNINEQIVTIQMWKTHSWQWKELQRMANKLTKFVFGEIIIIFILFTIMDITFFFFAIYISWKINSTGEVIGYGIMICVRAGIVVQLFRKCHRCKMEMIKTQIILNQRDKTRFSDYKEFQITTFYMMHNDCDFVPCNIFEISYNNLATITTIIVAYSAFQIQLSHFKMSED